MQQCWRSSNKATLSWGSAGQRATLWLETLLRIQTAMMVRGINPAMINTQGTAAENRSRVCSSGERKAGWKGAGRGGAGRRLGRSNSEIVLIFLCPE